MCKVTEAGLCRWSWGAAPPWALSPWGAPWQQGQLSCGPCSPARWHGLAWAWPEPLGQVWTGGLGKHHCSPYPKGCVGVPPCLCLPWILGAVLGRHSWLWPWCLPPTAVPAWLSSLCRAQDPPRLGTGAPTWWYNLPFLLSFGCLTWPCQPWACSCAS